MGSLLLVRSGLPGRGAVMFGIAYVASHYNRAWLREPSRKGRHNRNHWKGKNLSCRVSFVAVHNSDLIVYRTTGKRCFHLLLSICLLKKPIELFPNLAFISLVLTVTTAVSSGNGTAG